MKRKGTGEVPTINGLEKYSHIKWLKGLNYNARQTKCHWKHCLRRFCYLVCAILLFILRIYIWKLWRPFITAHVTVYLNDHPCSSELQNHPHVGLLFLKNKPSQKPRGMLGVNQELLFNQEVMVCSEVSCEPVHTTRELVPTSGKFWPFLTYSPPVCLCVDINKHTWQREINKSNHNISISQHVKYAHVISYTFPEVYLQNPEHSNTLLDIVLLWKHVHSPSLS